MSKAFGDSLPDTSIVERTILNTSQLTTEPTSNATFVPLSSDKWQIVNGTSLNSFVLAPGESLPFRIELKALHPGIYYLYPAFRWSYSAPNVQLQSEIQYDSGWKVNVNPTQTQLKACKEIGIAENDCTDSAIAESRISTHPALSDEDRKKMEEQQNQINNSMYMIGIGAAIAGIVAFMMLQKRK